MANPKKYSEKTTRKAEHTNSGLQIPAGSYNMMESLSIIKPLFQPHFRSIHNSAAKAPVSDKIPQGENESELQADRIAETFIHNDSELAHQIISQENSRNDTAANEHKESGPSDELTQLLQSSQGAGQEIEYEIREDLEEHTGSDLSEVKIHTNSQAHEIAKRLGAQAFSFGKDIYFQAGQYNPNSREGKELLAHEIVHAIQNLKMARPKVQKKEEENLGFKVEFPKTDAEIPVYVKDKITINIYVYSLIFGLGESELKASGINFDFDWTPGPLHSRADIIGKVFIFRIHKAHVDLLSATNAKAAASAEKSNTSGSAFDKDYNKLSVSEQKKITEETDRLFDEQFKLDRKLTKGDSDAYYRMQWKEIRADLLEKRKKVQELPQRTKDFLFKGSKNIEPSDYDKILALAEIVKGLSDEDLKTINLIGTQTTSDLDLVMNDLAMYIQAGPWVLRMHAAFENDIGLLSADGTDEQAVFRVLNHPPELLEMINAVYNVKYYPDGSGTMADDIDSEMDGDDWEFARMLLGRGGIEVPGQEIPAYVDIPGNIFNAQSKGIYSSDPGKTILQPGDEVFYSIMGQFESYDWGVLYESGNVLIAMDQSASFVPATDEQLDGRNMFRMKYSDFYFPGLHTITCRVTDENDKITYYAFTQQVRGPEENISTVEVKYELIAHDVAYRNFLGKGSKLSTTLTGDELEKQKKDYDGSKKDLQLLKSWGYNDEVIEENYEEEKDNGFYAVLILPQKGRTDLNPVIAMRGTSNTPDFITDSDIKGPGWTQYVKNKAHIANLIDKAKSYGKIDLTGHSLGGALCQWTATDESFKGKFQRVITFQSPAINAARVKGYNAWEKEEKPSTVIHHIVIDDIVPFAGEASMPGTFYTHKTQTFSPFLSHTHLMLQSQAYEGQKEKLGITDQLLESLGWTSSNLPTERNMVIKTPGFPFPKTRAKVEEARKDVRKKIDQLIIDIQTAKAKMQKANAKRLEMEKIALELYLELLTSTLQF